MSIIARRAQDLLSQIPSRIMSIIARREQDLLSQVNPVESCPSLPGGNRIFSHR